MLGSRKFEDGKRPPRGAANVIVALAQTLAVLVFVVAFAGCGPKKPTRTDRALGAGKFRWDSFPVSLRVDSGLRDGGPAEQDLREAVRFWEKLAGHRLFDIGTWPTGTAPFTGKPENPDELLDNVVYLMRPWPSGPDWGSRIAGKKIVHSTGSEIDNAVVFLNGDTALCSALCDNEGEHGMTSRRRLIAHELGHFLGFAHVSDRGNIMYPEIQPGGSLDTEGVDLELLHALTD